MGVKSQTWWKWSGWMVRALQTWTFSFCLQTTKVPKKGTEKWEWVVLLLHEVTLWGDFSMKRWKTCTNVRELCMSRCRMIRWVRICPRFQHPMNGWRVVIRSSRMSKLPSHLGYHTTADIKVPELWTWKQAMWSPNAEHGRKQLKPNISHWWNMTPGILSRCHMERNWSVVDGC